MVGLELQADDVPAAGQLGGHLVARERAEDGDVRSPVVLDGEEVELGLHVEVVEDEVDPAPGLRDDQPDAVHVVAVLLGVVGGQDNPRGRGEVEEARNWEDKRISNGFAQTARGAPAPVAAVAGGVLRLWLNWQVCL